MINNFRKINQLLTRRQRIAAVCLFGVMVLTGLMQVVSVTSILPFMAVVANPELVDSNRYLNLVYEGLGFTSTNQFLVFLGSIVLGAIITVNAVSAFGIWFRSRFSWALNLHISKRLLEKYLSQPYLFFVTRNSSEFSNTILSETISLTNGFVKPALELMTHGITVGLLFALVVLVNPMVALVAMGLFGGVYAGIYLVLRQKMVVIGEDRASANRDRFKAVQEAFGTIKETKILQREEQFVRGYEVPTRKMSRALVLIDVVSQMPRFVLEAFAFGGMVGLVLYFLLTMGPLSEFLPILSLYALAGYRMMPSLQLAFQSFSQIRFTQAVVDLICTDMAVPGRRERGYGMAGPETPDPSSGDRNEKDVAYGRRSTETWQVVENTLRPAAERLLFSREIEVSDISFAYPNTDRSALKGVSLKIPYHSSVAFCGPTGSGKTTVVDVILGLLEPDQGELMVDGVAITASNRRSWQRNLGYVPQSIYLSDTIIAENIAYGVPRENIDLEAVHRAAQIANIAEFIKNELPKGYDTIVGERGVRLSGGQRQRIGLARALYHNPEVLILDEATSALDGATEEAVMEAVRQVAQAKTVIIIAHRLTTVRDCDRIFLLNDGRLSGAGSYEKLIVENAEFRRMARKDGREALPKVKT